MSRVAWSEPERSHRVREIGRLETSVFEEIVVDAIIGQGRRRASGSALHGQRMARHFVFHRIFAGLVSTKLRQELSLEPQTFDRKPIAGPAGVPAIHRPACGSAVRREFGGTAPIG
jgi:hypothetical protein